MKLKFYAVLMLFSLVNPSHAQKLESIKQLKETVKQFIGSQISRTNPNSNIKIEINRVDRRLKLAKCPTQFLKIASPNNRSIERSTTISVRCLGPIAWSIFIPFEIKVFKKVVLARNHIRRNQVLTPDDIQLVEIDTKNLSHGYFLQIKDVIGKVARRVILKNRIVHPNSLKFAKLIRKGDVIYLTAVNQAIKVSVKGIALQNGQLGQFIAVKNLTSKKVIEGKVVGKKEVYINL